MENEEKSFNLLDQPWIKVRTFLDREEEVSIVGLFRNATTIKALSNDLPTQDFALLRLLLAILQRSIAPRIEEYDYPSDLWGDLWTDGKLPVEDIELYLAKWRQRFDLLDEEQPFMQTAGLRAQNDSVSEIKKVLADYPDGLALFTLRSGEGARSMSLAEAARWVVHAHAFDTSGIKTGVVGDKGAKGGKSYPIGTGWAGGLGGVYLEGTNLAQTLLLNLCLCADCENAIDEFLDEEFDIPVWERPQAMPGDSGREPTGYADVYTWQSRRMLLCASGGLVDGLLLTNGDKLAYHNRRAIEPMTAWRRSHPQEKKLRITPVYLPYTHQIDRLFWRGLTVVLPERNRSIDDEYCAPGILLWAGHLASANGGKKLPASYPVRLHATGFVYGVQSSTFSEMINDSLDLSALLLSPDGEDAIEMIKHCIGETDEAVRALGYLVTNVRLAAGCDGPLAKDARVAAQTEAYYEIDSLFRKWLSSICNGSVEALRVYEKEWRDTVYQLLLRLGKQYIDDADGKAIQGRKIKRGNQELWMSAGRAESQFWFSLRRILSDKDSPRVDGVEEE